MTHAATRPHLAYSAPIPASGRVPPHNLDAEATVLAAVILDGGPVVDRVIEVTAPEQFYSDANGAILEAAIAVRATPQPVNIVTIASWLRDRERLATIGGATYLAQLANETPFTADVETHASLVRDKWRLRQAIATHQRLAAEGYGDVGPLQDWLDAGERDVGEVARSYESTDIDTIRTVVVDEFKRIQANAERGGVSTGLLTGYRELDALMGGMTGGDNVILAARPGQGKTALGTQIAINVARQQREGEPVNVVLVFSVEMPKNKLAPRMLCTEAGVGISSLNLLQLGVDDWAALADAGRRIKGLPLYLDDTRPITPSEIRAKCRRLRATLARDGWSASPEEPPRPARLALVVVDYLQKLDGKAMVGRNATREQEVAAISKSLADLWVELDVPGLVLAQVGRPTDKVGAKDRRPTLAMLRESGAIEQDATSVVFLHREEYWLKDACPADLRGVAELDHAKARSGTEGVATTRYYRSCGRYEDPRTGQEGSR